MNKQQVQKQLDKLIREEMNLRGKAYKAALPFNAAAHKVHSKWQKLYKEYIWMENK